MFSALNRLLKLSKIPGGFMGMIVLANNQIQISWKTCAKLSAILIIGSHGLLKDLLTASKCPFVVGLFPPLLVESSKFSSIGSRFKLQLQSLMETLSTTEPHYIRCVKPNNVLKPAIFENLYIIQQLRCGSVLEAIRISCAGYPTRRAFDEFLLRFGVLYPDVLDGKYDEKVACQMLLDKMGLKCYPCNIFKKIIILEVTSVVRAVNEHTTERNFLSYSLI